MKKKKNKLSKQSSLILYIQKEKSCKVFNAIEDKNKNNIRRKKGYSKKIKNSIPKYPKFTKKFSKKIQINTFVIY